MVDDCKGILTFEDAVKAIQEAHHTEVTGIEHVYMYIVVHIACVCV